MLSVEYVAVGRGDGGAIITSRFECVQMTVGTPLHSTGVVEGMTTITPCKMLSESEVQKNSKK